MPPRARNRWKKGWTGWHKGNFLPSELYILTRVGTLATKISPVVHLNMLKVTCFMVEVARMPPDSQKWRGMVIIHQKGGVWVDFLAFFSILCLRMASHLVGKCLKLNKISCRTFWYAILTTRWLWKVSVVKKIIKNLWNGKKTPTFWRFFAPWPPSRPPIWTYGASLWSLDQKLSHAL